MKAFYVLLLLTLVEIVFAKSALDRNKVPPHSKPPDSSHGDGGGNGPDNGAGGGPQSPPGGGPPSPPGGGPPSPPGGGPPSPPGGESPSPPGGGPASPPGGGPASPPGGGGIPLVTTLLQFLCPLLQPVLASLSLDGLCRM
ncbi:PREDICTED: proline-rich antigen homolog [Trachymyrmex septentrionalis]|uniref:proline-rich antigen homolog n=1 Tax=Trachymyrmex septentrionalis TaxID=34720 RepID=UPI00084EF87B|nr:PREDICTED: proline-rich antigen homolog [Trachymyrmex septentrionalis]